MAALSGFLDPIRRFRDRSLLTRAARDARARDGSHPGDNDPGIPRSIAEAAAWLNRAQDCSSTRDGGVARHFSLVDGWGASYPESTGYIVPTMFALANRSSEWAAHRPRAQRMLNWLLTTQLPGGGFQGGTVSDRPVVPVAFNTGQVLLGLAAGAAEYGANYLDGMHRAAAWLTGVQDADGCWRRHESPFACSGPKAYDSHAAWGLFEAARASGEAAYAKAAAANIRWTISQQRPNGWFTNCCLTDSTQPLTHTLGYALRGILEGYRHTREPDFLNAARLTGEALLRAMRPDGFIAGRLDADWRETVSWSCLTGTCQIAHCWLELFLTTGESDFRDAGRTANGYVRRTIAIDGPPETRGAVKGSFPISGGYGPYRYPNWATKFFIDSNLLELDILESRP